MNLLAISAVLLSTFMVGSGQLVGGYKKHENCQNDANVKEVAEFAVEEISKAEGDKLELVKIVSLSTQVVAGKNYQMLLDTATPLQKLQPYEVTVYEPLGNQKKQLSQYKKVDRGNAEMASEQLSERNSAPLLGGYQEVGANESEVQEAAEFALQQISQRSNSLVAPQLQEVLQAKQKVTDGKVWDLKLKVLEGKTAKIYAVQVSRSLQNKFSLIEATSL